MQYVVGIDLGGTKIMICIMDINKKIIQKTILPTQVDKGPDYMANRIRAAISCIAVKAGIKFADICAVGLGAPGPLDFKKGIMINPPNFPGWNGVPLAKLLSDWLDLPIVMENDVNAAALAEGLFGAGIGEDNFVYISIGTGIGGGVIIDGEILRGAGGNAAEVGHLTINFDGPVCGCGNRGCWEAYASGKALARFAQEGLQSGINTMITKLAKDDEITAEHVFNAAKQKDDFASRLVENEGFYLGVGLANILNTFNPKTVAFGGGIAEELDMFYGNMMSVARKRAIETNRNARVVKAMLGTNAGVMGAAIIAWQFIKSGTGHGFLP